MSILENIKNLLKNEFHENENNIEIIPIEGIYEYGVYLNSEYLGTVCFVNADIDLNDVSGMDEISNKLRIDADEAMADKEHTTAFVSTQVDSSMVPLAYFENTIQKLTMVIKSLGFNVVSPKQ